jgi:hypothetical protein
VWLLARVKTALPNHAGTKMTQKEKGKVDVKFKKEEKCCKIQDIFHLKIPLPYHVFHEVDTP